MIETIATHAGILLSINLACLYLAYRLQRPNALPPMDPREGECGVDGTVVGCSAELVSPVSATQCVFFYLRRASRPATPGEPRRYLDHACAASERIDVLLASGLVESFALSGDIWPIDSRTSKGRIAQGVSLQTCRILDDPSHAMHHPPMVAGEIVRESVVRVGDAIYLSGRFTRARAGIRDPLRRADEGTTERTLWLGQGRCLILAGRHRDLKFLRVFTWRIAANTWELFVTISLVYCGAAVVLLGG